MHGLQYISNGARISTASLSTYSLKTTLGFNMTVGKVQGNSTMSYNYWTHIGFIAIVSWKLLRSLTRLANICSSLFNMVLLVMCVISLDNAKFRTVVYGSPILSCQLHVTMYASHISVAMYHCSSYLSCYCT